MAALVADRVAAESSPEAPERVQAPEPVAMPQPSSAAEASADETTTGSTPTTVVDLATIWRLAGIENPTINRVRATISEALALQKAARVLMLPSFNPGTNYHYHSGNLLASFGQVRDVTENSLYIGGARALAAETVGIPAIRIFSHLGDALYEPLAARQEVAVRRWDTSATVNSTLLDVTVAYLNLMRAETSLQAYQLSEQETREVQRLTEAFARAGQGSVADAYRARTEALLMHNAVLRAEEQMNVASAELAQLVNLDPSLNLRTVGGALSTIELVDALVPLEELVVIANGRRPELASASAAIDRSRVRVRQEQTRVLFPTIMLGYSPGAFGGNGNFVGGIPPFASITGREDYDVWCYWTAQNMGVGNVAQTRRQRGMLGQAMADRLRVLNEVRAQVAEAYNDAHAFLQRAEEAQLGLESSTSGFREDLNRQRSGEGLPLEVLNSVRLMATERQDLATAVVGYNEAQFRLFVALGQPPTCVRSSSAPQNGPSSTTEPIFRGEPVGASGIR